MVSTPSRPRFPRYLLPWALLQAVTACAATSPGADEEVFDSTQVTDTDTPTETCPHACDCGVAWLEGQEPFDTVQDAIDAAFAGQTVHVCSGTHHELLVVDTSGRLVPGDFLIIEGDGADLSFVDASYVEPVDVGLAGSSLVPLSVSDVSLEVRNLTISGGEGITPDPDGGRRYSFAGGVYIANSAVSLVNVDITDNSADGGAGIYAFQASVTVDGGHVLRNGPQIGAGDPFLPGGGAGLILSTLQSNDVDWGVEADDNRPHDVALNEWWDASDPAVHDAGAGATFTCDTASRTCG